MNCVQRFFVIQAFCGQQQRQGQAESTTIILSCQFVTFIDSGSDILTDILPQINDHESLHGTLFDRIIELEFFMEITLG